MEQKMNELLDVMDDKDLDVICVSETKRKGNVMTDLSNIRIQRIRCQVMEARMFRGADLGTDHYLVVARIRGLFAGWRSRTTCPSLASNYRIRSWKLQDAPMRKEYQERVSKKLESCDSGYESVEVC